MNIASAITITISQISDLLEDQEIFIHLEVKIAVFRRVENKMHLI